MKSAVLFATNKPLEIIEIDDIPALKPGQVLVRVIYSGLCHSQLMEATGGRGEDKYLPHMMGHEASARVEAVGEGVTKVKPGDDVILGWIRGKGKEAPGGLYSFQNQTINSGGVTTFCEQSIVAENRVVKVPTGLPLDVAVLFGCALLTGAGLVMREVCPKPQSSIAIFGLGGIGLSALIVLQRYAPAKIIAIDIEDEKLKLAKTLGATHTVQIDSGDVLQHIDAICPGGVDYAIEASGKTHIIETAFLSVRDQGGLCVFASHPPDGEKIRLDPLTMHRGKQIKGSWGGSACPDEDIPKLAALYHEKKLPLEKLLSKRYRLEQINVALDDLKQRRIARGLLEINPQLDPAYTSS